MNIRTYDKPFKTHIELIEIMRSRNIEITDVEFTKRVLNSLSYYTIINGYKNSFLSVQGTDNFIIGTKFDDLYTLHLLDVNLNSIIFKNILYIERTLKSRIAYIISSQYGVFTARDDLVNNNPDDYLCRNHYSRSSPRRNNILRKIKGELNSNRISDSVAHYANTKNHIPAWILVTTIPFGLAINWYNILKVNDKSQVCKQFIPSDIMEIQDKKEFLKVSLDLLKEYRNKIAHGDRTFNVQNLPILPKDQLISLSDGLISLDEYDKNQGKNDLFAVIIVLYILLDDRYILANLLHDLIYILEPHEKITINGKTIFEIFGLPNNIFERLRIFLIQNYT